MKGTLKRELKACETVKREAIEASSAGVAISHELFPQMSASLSRGDWVVVYLVDEEDLGPAHHRARHADELALAEAEVGPKLVHLCLQPEAELDDLGLELHAVQSAPQLVVLEPGTNSGKPK